MEFHPKRKNSDTVDRNPKKKKDVSAVQRINISAVPRPVLTTTKDVVTDCGYRLFLKLFCCSVIRQISSNCDASASSFATSLISKSRHHILCYNYPPGMNSP